MRLDDLASRHPGLSVAVAASHEEAARVCLDRHHQPPVEVKLVDAGTETQSPLNWIATNERARIAWANDVDATEAGAYAVSLAALESLRGLVALGRAETGTGADYYVGEPSSGREDLEDCLRLEVSGTDAGSPKEIERRLDAKVAQARRGHSSLPALAAVVGFRELEVRVADVRLSP